MNNDIIPIKLAAIQHRDKIKDQYCQQHNIRLIRIPYTEYKKIDNILRTKLLTK